MSAFEIILDETSETAPIADYIVVETEIEFLRQDTGATRLWVRGAALSEYVRILCQARKIKLKEMVSPRNRLCSIIGNIADEIEASLLNRSLEILERKNPKNVGELLLNLTHDEFWIESVSTEHAARFLTIDLSQDIFDLVEIQQKTWLQSNQDSKLKEIYATEIEKREDFLQKWFFDEKIRQNLGEFPLLLSGNQAAFLLKKIEKNLRETEGAIAADFPQNTPNKKIYARATEEYFSHHPNRLTADLLARVSPLLSSMERGHLEKLLPIAEIIPLPINADLQTALNWTTGIYLPFRHAPNSNDEQCARADILADSFADWLLENYPKMAFGDYENSPINLRTFYTVKNLLERGFWVLWTVVDGLNYTNHQKLLRVIGEKSAHLRVAENSPVFAVLPTITEKAKYGLTNGKFPSENATENWGTKSNFLANFPNGFYAGSTGMSKMADGLQSELPTVCYWNYLRIDECYHDETDAISITHEVEAQITALAAKINSLVESAHNKNRVAVVICSDHGQMTNNCHQSKFEIGERHAHGRTALDTAGTIFTEANSTYIKSSDGETVYLNPTSFRLSEPATIALGATYFKDLKATAKTGAVGVHGGLYPEEAVIGLAVLMRDPAHQPLSAFITGNGESGKSGTIIFTVDNPNSVTVNPLSLTIENLVVENQEELLLAKITSKDAKNFEIPIEKFPAPTSGEEFEIKGILRYEFDDGMQNECSITGKIICKSLYTAKNPSLLNRFKK